MRTPPENAELALLLEVAGTPKPGNVDRRRDHPTLRFEHFLAGAVGSSGGLRAAADGAAVGTAFERAVAGMADQTGGNTQFGALLLLTPLVQAASTGSVTPTRASKVVENTTVADAAAFYRAFEHVAVAVDDPPADADAPDVRRGADAIDALESAGTSLYDVMGESATVDDVAREWVTGFERSFRAGERIADGDGPVVDRAAETYRWMLARRPDTFVAKNHGEDVARQVMERAEAASDEGAAAVDAFADELVAEGINPGTTADLTAAGLFVALEAHGVRV